MVENTVGGDLKDKLILGLERPPGGRTLSATLIVLSQSMSEGLEGTVIRVAGVRLD